MPKVGYSNISLRVKNETDDRLEILAKMMQASKSAIIRWAIEAYLTSKLKA